MYTKEQQLIIDAGCAALRNLSLPYSVVLTDASAGSGKTTSINGLIDALPKGTTILATSFTTTSVNNLRDTFNKYHIPISPTPPHPALKSIYQHAVKTNNGATATVATINALGNAILYHGLRDAQLPLDYAGKCASIVPQDEVFNYTIESTKLNRIINLWFRKFRPDLRDPREIAELRRQMTMVIKIIRADLIPLNDIDRIWHICHDIRGEVKERDTINTAIEILKLATVFAVRTGIIDFDEQVYLPVVLGLSMPHKKDQLPQRFDVLAIDEFQNQSKARKETALIYLREGGVLFAVGDRQQEIMGFSGVSIGQFAKTAEQYKIKPYRLSQSFRFGQRIADTVLDVVPDLVGMNTDSRNTVTYRDGFPTQFPPNSAIVCRTNSQMVRYASILNKNGVLCNFTNEKFSEELIKLVKDIGKEYHTVYFEFNYSDFSSFIIDQTNKIIEEISAYASPDYIAFLQQRYNIVLELAGNFQTNSFSEFLSTISKVLTSRRGVTLITTHQAQGLQWSDVFVVEDDYNRAIQNENDGWKIEAERQTKYVAYTRAIHELHIVTLLPVKQNSVDALLKNLMNSLSGDET